MLQEILLDTANHAARIAENNSVLRDVIGNVPDHSEVAPNLFDSASPQNVQDVIYNTTTDQYDVSGNRFDTHPIPVEEGEQYYISHSLSLSTDFRPRFLDSGDNIVHLSNDNSVCPAGFIFNVPTGLDIQSLRFSVHDANINVFEIRKVVITKELSTGEQFLGKSATFIGDSIVAGKAWAKPMMDKLGIIEVANNAVGGSTASQFSAQVVSADILASDIVFIGFGTNDHANGVALGTEASLSTSDNFSGHMRNLIETVYSVKNDVRIVLLTPPHNANSRSDSTGNRILMLKAYVDMIKEVGSQYSAVVVDVFGESGIAPENVSQFMVDGTHPNRFGGDRIASLVVKKLKSL